VGYCQHRSQYSQEGLGEISTAAMGYFMIYKADIAGVALKPQESRVIAAWLLGRNGPVTEDTWQELIYRKNEVQIKGRSTLRRQSNLIKARLKALSPEMLEIIADGSFRETIQACLCAAIKHSRLMGDFLDIVIRNEISIRNREISRYQWRTFLEDCRNRDPEMTEWTPNTTSRIQTSVFSILQEAGILKREKALLIQPIDIEERVVRQLDADNESYILKCLRYAS
jgi:hypothetical protein